MEELQRAVATALRERTGLFPQDVALDEHMPSLFGKYVEEEASPDEIVDVLIDKYGLLEFC